MLSKGALCLLLIASFVYSSEALESQFLRLIDKAHRECLPKYNITGHELYRDLKNRGKLSSRDLCSVICLLENLNAFDEGTFDRFTNFARRLHINADEPVESTDADREQKKQEFFRRVYVKLAEINGKVCSINDAEVREQTWNTWRIHEKQLFLNATEIDDVEDLHKRDDFKEKLEHYFSGIALSSEPVKPSESEILGLIVTALNTCGTKMNVTGNDQTVTDFLIQKRSGEIDEKEYHYLFYCAGEELGVVDANGVNDQTPQLIEDIIGPLEDGRVEGRIASVNKDLEPFRASYLQRIGATPPAASA